MDSRIEPLPISGAWRISPTVFADDRGSLHEPFHSGQFEAATGIDLVVRQATCSISQRAVLRGIRVSAEARSAKYVTCTAGVVLDVVVDVRVGSETFGRWHAERLDHETRTALYLPSGLGHAFLALSDTATLLYLLSRPHQDKNERTINALDPDLAITWPPDITPLRSARDAAAPGLIEARQAQMLPTFATHSALHRDTFARRG
ncbi:dTDP-4-dehydrorhamnose 3,5-epimerase [Amycolatopsis sp., V23-08]|uniref:dTDP-4-dehydrorhamnose 3,5-epimerase n=1 Tax=Amycolatopsis heterodermiae TaxID=3110235 RepID=A0ABU5RLL5_9PSEU|nr:dTDP-4-dehydrorhamnose 3,5-epimerase [Amycolatopsis sp., V23-08]MEA5367183.1 dTDP-4-dehydrorhamnose 3,5-epimerase [Amycolatopsis sp., V23-08]